MSFENEKRKIHQIINQLSYSCFTHGVFVWSCWLRSWKKKPNAETGNERDVKRTTWERVWACMPLKVFWLWFCTELSEPELCPLRLCPTQLCTALEPQRALQALPCPSVGWHRMKSLRLLWHQDLCFRHRGDVPRAVFSQQSVPPAAVWKGQGHKN